MEEQTETNPKRELVVRVPLPGDIHEAALEAMKKACVANLARVALEGTEWIDIDFIGPARVEETFYIDAPRVTLPPEDQWLIPGVHP
ncbi:MAG: hypothetical protein ACREGG_00195 [Candidatus Saccharimonadales bacterium]